MGSLDAPRSYLFMLISVVTPVLNGARTIARTLDSIAAQKGEFEHIVMDAGSKDATESIVQTYLGRYPVQWHQKKDRSLYEGVWNGMQHARGDVLCYINADDQYLPWTLATVRAVFERNPDVEWITGVPGLLNESTGVGQLTPVIPIFPRSWIRRGWYSPGGMGGLQQESMFWRRSLWERSNPSEILLKYRLAADFNLWRRFAEHAELRTVNSLLASFTVSDGQLSWKQRDEYLRECGLRPDQNRRRTWMRLASRMACIAGQFRVLQVPWNDNR